MKYPSWVDPFIVEFVDECILADRLCNGGHAEEFWEVLREHSEFLGKFKGSDKSSEFYYYLQIKAIFKGIANLPHVSPGKVKKHAEKAAALARELAQELTTNFETLGYVGKVPEAIGLDRYALPVLKDEVFVFEPENDGIVKRMVFGGVEYGSSKENVLGVARESREVYINYRDEKQAGIALVEDWRRRWGVTDEQWHDDAFIPTPEADADFPEGVKLVMSKNQIRAKIIDNAVNLTVTKVLYQLAKEMDEYKDGVFLVNRPNIEGVVAKALMREVHEFHVLHYGQPLNDVISLLITVALDLDGPLMKDDIRL